MNGNANNVGHAVQGLYGALTLNSDGGYTYNATHGSSLPGDGVGFDTFTYTAKDGAGDTASTDLTVVVVSSTENYLGGAAGTTINGGSFKFGGQVLDGSLGNDVLLAGKSATVEIGGPNDTLTGNLNAADHRRAGRGGLVAIAKVVCRSHSGRRQRHIESALIAEELDSAACADSPFIALAGMLIRGTVAQTKTRPGTAPV